MLRGALLSVVLALAGCYRGVGAEDPAFKRGGSTLPLGVLQPSSETSGIGAYTGIYPTEQPDDPACCWIASSASFEMRVPPHAGEMILTTFVPGSLEVFKKRRQTLTVAVDGGAARRFTLRNGVSFLHVPLAQASRQRIADVVLEAGFAFVPNKERINNDSRELAFYLKSVRVNTR